MMMLREPVVHGNLWWTTPCCRIASSCKQNSFRYYKAFIVGRMHADWCSTHHRGSPKLEYNCPPSPNPRKKENQPKSSHVHLPTFWSLLCLQGPYTKPHNPPLLASIVPRPSSNLFGVSPQEIESRDPLSRAWSRTGCPVADVPWVQELRFDDTL